MIVPGCATTHATASDQQIAAATPSHSASRGDRLSAPRQTMISRYLNPPSRRPIAIGAL